MRRSIVTFLVLAGLGGLLACETQSATSEAAMAEVEPAEDQAGLEVMEHHRHHHLGGITQFIALSLDTLGEEDAKRPQVEQLQRELYECMAPAREIKTTLLRAMADDIAAGTVDTTKVEARVVQLEAAVAAQKCRGEAMSRLHEILSPVERAALVDKVDAHWAVWRNVNDQEEGGGQRQVRRLSALVEELGLTTDQVDKISAALKASFASNSGKFERDKAAAQVRGFTDSFAKESFDAKAVTGEINPYLATFGSRRMALFYASVTPTLTQEQRVKLAAYVREHADRQPFAMQDK